ncbi:MAG: DUF5722 domain-containing protein [Lachnospiraceae bacterium]|jgi:uncharacterized repeat protein (TIGR02543 family)|nr:DUF5722 domain-containing protein [Lachnospiraceae bacterium]
MKRWKKFIAMGLAVSMIVPSCIPQTLWASEFSAGSVESAADVFEDGAEYETGSESGNKISDENNSGDEFGTGELKDQEPEQSETEDSVNAGQSAEGYNILLYSDGKLEKTYVIPYADADTAKVPEALRGKTGYIFKEWNTKEDGTGETYKPGESIKKLLETADMAKQAQETSERTEAGEEIKPEKDVMQEENDVAQTDSASWEEKTGKAEMQISDTENDGTSPDISTDKAIAAGDTTAITLYAIWEKASEYKITYKLNKGKNNTANPKTYTSEDEIKFKKPTRSGYHFVGWYTDSKYKNQISVIEKGSEGSLTLYAKWTKEISPSAKAASLDYVKGTKANTITVSATVSNYVKSSDGYYYLVYVDSNFGKVKKTVGKVKKPEKAKGKITFKLNISGHPEYAQGKFAIGIKKSKSAYSVISPKSYVSNPEKLSTNTAAYFVPGTKKGIQATDINELTDTKSKTVFFNLYISDLMRKDSGVEPYKYNGKTYHFNGLYGYVYLVQQCNAKGIQVTAQISIDRNASTQSFITGNSPYAETAYYGWNTDNSTTRQTMEAMFAYLGEKFGKNNCYISNWILGNEVNSASGYYYVGNVSFSKFISMYSEAFRCLYNAVKSSRGSSKVFICLDNCWNQKNAFTICYSARSTLESFAAKISDMQKDVNWNLAYHAYNQPLSDSQFWSGANASMFTSDANTTTFITMRNIQTLTDYVKNRFGSNTRIILSEQGFSSTYGGQANQAAAIALAYYKAACNPMIDAFIIRSYKDEAHEVAQGLAMGLKDANGKKKTAYNVFKNMDSSNSLKYTEKVLKSQVGNWKSLVPGYSTGKISSMYRK